MIEGPSNDSSVRPRNRQPSSPVDREEKRQRGSGDLEQDSGTVRDAADDPPSSSPSAQTGIRRYSRLGVLWRSTLCISSILAVCFCLMYVIALLSISLSEEPVAQAVSLADFNVSVSETSVSVTEAGASIAETGFSLVQTNPSIAETGLSVAETSAPASVPGVEGQRNECPPCESFFGKLERNDAGGLSQAVRMQVRGEPKSGTSFMFEWAINALVVTCNHLELLYGKGTCSIRWKRNQGRSKAISKKASVIQMKQVALVFEPKARKEHALPDGCRCEDVDRVSVEISHFFKHDLPVPRSCPWQHVDGVTSEGQGCSVVKGRPVQSDEDVLGCLSETPCDISDDRLQMLVLRDPRAVTVSSYYWLLTHERSFAKKGEGVEDFVVRMLPTICRFVHVRYALLWAEMPDETEEFLYEDTLADPLGWHQRWLPFVGLTLPESVVVEAMDIALRKDFAFAGKGVDKHPGGEQSKTSLLYEEELGPEVRSELDRIARVWLPQVLLEKFGIPLQ